MDEELIVLVFYRSENSNNIKVDSRELSIELDNDEIEYAIIRFKESLTSKSFYPAEFCEGTCNKRSISIYAQYV